MPPYSDSAVIWQHTVIQQNSASCISNIGRPHESCLIMLKLIGKVYNECPTNAWRMHAVLAVFPCSRNRCAVVRWQAPNNGPSKDKHCSRVRFIMLTLSLSAIQPLPSGRCPGQRCRRRWRCFASGEQRCSAPLCIAPAAGSGTAAESCRQPAACALADAAGNIPGDAEKRPYLLMA